MRIINKRRYIFAFIITCAIFFLGFFFGFLMDITRVDYFEKTNSMNQLNIRSLQLQQELFSDMNFKDQCKASRFLFDKAITELENNRERLETYNRQAGIKKEEFEIMRREYTISQINFLRIATKLKNSCPEISDYVTIIYFYSDKEKCPTCDDQATILNYYKLTLKENLLIFALDEQLEEDEPLIKMIKEVYDVKSYPTLIIFRDTYQDGLNKEDLGKVLCKYYKTNETRSRIC